MNRQIKHCFADKKFRNNNKYVHLPTDTILPTSGAAATPPLATPLSVDAIIINNNLINNNQERCIQTPTCEHLSSFHFVINEKIYVQLWNW